VTNWTFERRAWRHLGAVIATVAAMMPLAPALHAQSAGATVAEWGAFGAGPLGTTACCASRATPTGVPGAGKAIAAAAIGTGGTVIVRPDGSVWAWGDALLSPAISLLPRQVPGMAGAATVAAGQSFVLVLKTDGTVWSWGVDVPALGRPPTGASPATQPAQIQGLPRIASIAAAGDDALAVGIDGSLYAWGENWTGEIGDGTRTERRTPVLVSGLSNVISAATSNQNALAVEADGSVWAWGDDASGVPVHAGLIQSLVPVRVSSVPPATQVAAGFSTGLALARDGTVWAWGENSSDALHTGHPSSGADGSSPAHVLGLQNVTAIASGSNRYMAIERDGSVWTWAGGLGGPARQSGLSGATAIAASPTGWIALVSAPPPAPHVATPIACTKVVGGRVTMLGYPSALQVDEATGHVFLIGGPTGSTTSTGAPNTICGATLTTIDGHTGRPIRNVLLGAGTPTFTRSPIAVVVGQALVQTGTQMVAAYAPLLPSTDTAAGISTIDTRTGRLLRSISIGYSVTGVAADPAAHRVLAPGESTPGGGHTLAIVDASGAMHTVAIPFGGASVVDAMAHHVVVLGLTSSVTLDTRTGVLVHRAYFAGGSLQGYGVAPRAHRLYLSYGVSPHCCGPSLVVLNTVTGRVISQTKIVQYGAVIMDAPRGRVLIARDTTTEVRNAATGRVLRRLPFAVGPGTVDAHTGRVYTITDPKTVSAVDATTWKVVARYHPGGTIGNLALDRATGRLFLLTWANVTGSRQTLRSVCVVAGCR
jgi:alpha-tubulin suppressor-like RCC1 family protein